MRNVMMKDLRSGMVTGSGRTILGITTPEMFPNLRTIHFVGGFQQTAFCLSRIQIRDHETIVLDKTSIGN